MTNANRRRVFNAARLPVLALALLAVLLTFLSGGDTAGAFTLGENLGDYEFDLADSATLAQDNGNPTGIWSDGTTMWVVDELDDKIFAYTMDPEGDDHGDRDTSKEFNLDNDNSNPFSVASDGTTMWVADNTDNKLYAYTLSTGAYDSSKEITLNSNNTAPWATWTDGTTMWVADASDRKLYAYTLSNGDRDSSKEFNLASGNNSPRGMWSDGTTMWVDDNDAKVYAYTIDGGARDETKEFNLASGNTNERGIWSDGATMWVADNDDDKLFAYDLTRANLYFSVPATSYWTGVAGTDDRIYLSNDFVTGGVNRIRPIDRSDRSEVTAERINTNTANNDIQGIWTDGTHVWAIEESSTTLYAYLLSDRSYVSGENLTLDSNNADPRDLWGNDSRLYVLDRSDDQIYVYLRSNGSHQSSEDISLHSDNGDPFGISSDGVTMWVSDGADDKVYAYTLSTRARDESKEFDLHDDNDNPRGMWFDGTHMHVVERVDRNDPLYRYDISDLAQEPTPTVTLVLSQRAISENGGTAEVTATLNRASTAVTTITISESSDAVSLSSNVTLTIAANATASSGMVTLTGVYDGVFTGNRFVTVSGAATNTEGVEGPADVRLIVRDEETVPSYAFGMRMHGLEFDLDSSNSDSKGIWSDGETMWVVDDGDDKLYAYTMDPEGPTHGARDEDKEFDLAEHSTNPVLDNSDPRGIWSDGTTMRVVDTDREVYAYRLSNGSRDSSKDFSLVGTNRSPRGTWSDGAKIWVADSFLDQLFNYSLVGFHTPALDISLDNQNDNPGGIWSDGTTVWVVDATVNKFYAYTLSTGSRDESKDFDLHSENANPFGIWSDGETMWVADSDDNKVYAYALTRSNPYFSIPSSNNWSGVAGTDDRIYLSNDFDTGGANRIRVIDRIDRSEDTSERITTNTANNDIRGIWTDGTHIWAVEDGSTTLYAYLLSDQSYVSGENVTLDSNNDDPVGLWGDDSRLYVLDETDDKVYVYLRSNGSHQSAEDIGLHSDNAHPRGIASDGVTIWVSDSDDDKVYAYTLSTRARDESKEFDLHEDNDNPRGMWFDGGHIHVVQRESGSDTLYRYNTEITVTLELSQQAISENGGTANVTATLNRASTAATTITISESSDAVSLSSNVTLTIATGLTDSSGIVTLTGVDDGVFTGNRFVTVRGTATNTEGVEGPADVRLVVLDDEAFKPGENLGDLEFDLAESATLTQDNGDPRGNWSDGATVWVSDEVDGKLYAYTMDPEGDNHGDRDSSKDITLNSSNSDPAGIWSDGTTIWVADYGDDKLFAYTLSTRARDTAKEFSLHSNNGNPSGIWSDGTYVWVADVTDDKLYTYALSTGTRQDGTGATTNREFNLASGNGNPVGIWSDGTTIWVGNIDVTLNGRERLFAYTLSNGNRDTTKEFTLPLVQQFPYGIWSDGSTIWVGDSGDDKVFAYDLTRSNPYFSIPSSSYWSGVAGTDDRIYLSNDFVTGGANRIRVIDRSDGSEDTSERITTNTANDDIRGIWTDGTHVWAVEDGSTTLYAYLLSDQSYVSGENVTLDSNNDDPVGLWGDDSRLYVLDETDDKVYVYLRSNGSHQSAEDIGLHSDNAHPRGIASDGVTIWVSDSDDDKVYAYTLSTRARDESKEFDLHDDNDNPRGMWFDGTHMHVVERGGSASTLYRYKITDMAKAPTPTVTLELSQRAVPENGGTARVTATLNRASTAATTITISESSDAVSLSSNVTLTIATGLTDSSGIVTLTGVDDGVFTGNRFVTVRGTATNTEGVEGPADVRLVVHDDETVALESFQQRESALDFNDLQAAGNHRPFGNWSDGSTMWVADDADIQLYAYRMNPGGSGHGDRQNSREFNLDAENTNATGIWSDGTTMWVTDLVDDKLYAYELSGGARDEDKDIDLDANNGDAWGIWSDGTTIWVADEIDDKLFAYTLDPGGDGHGDRDSGKDITLAHSATLSEDNGDPRGIWSDGATIWVADSVDTKLYSYTLSTATRASAKDHALHSENTSPVAIFSDGTSLWVADSTADKLFAYAAEDRTITPPPRRGGTKVNLWPGRGTATLTAKDLAGSFGCSNAISGKECSDTNILTDDDFIYGANRYAITSIYLQGTDLHMVFDSDPTEDLGSATLHVASSTFAYTDSQEVGTPDHRVWNTSLSWSANQQIELKITVPCGKGGQGYQIPPDGSKKHFSLGCMQSYDEGKGPDQCGVGDFIARGAVPVRRTGGQNAPADPPTVPTNLEATAASDGIALTWDEVAGADSYNVQRRLETESVYADIGASTTNSYTDATAVVGQGYAYKVQAVNDAGSSDFSTHVLARIEPPAVAEMPPPTGLQAVVAEDNESVTLTWTAPDDDTVTVQAYIVTRLEMPAGPADRPTALGHPAATTYTDSNVDGGASYRYGVSAIGSGGESAAVTVDVDIPAQVAQSNPGPLSGFTLVDASDHSDLATLTAGSSVALADPSGGSYGLRADLAEGETVGSVSMELTGAKTASRTENFAPYSLYGDSRVDGVKKSHGEALPVGSYTLTATAYENKNLGGDELGTLTVSFTITQANRAPEFGSATYDMSIAENAATGAAVGSVSATDADNHSLTYTITAGNGDAKFAISNTGAITTAGALDYESDDSYTLTMQADDNNGGTATATVNISVTDVYEDPDATRETAVSLGAQSPSEGRQYFRNKSLDRANGDGVDYYTFTTDGRYVLGLGVRDQDVQLKVVLEDAEGNVVGTAGPPLNPDLDQVYIEWLKITIDAGTYYIRVEALADGQTDYYIRFGLTEP